MKDVFSEIFAVKVTVQNFPEGDFFRIFYLCTTSIIIMWSIS